MMKHVILCGMIAAGVACAPMRWPTEVPRIRDRIFLKDSAITTKVKDEMAGEAPVDVDQKQSRYRGGRPWSGSAGRAPTHDASEWQR